ncbi:MAG: hypothetical protein IT324_09755 [Anaerolineae bacterium]|nr:hypothetical protein [Anaerolineae bacterium]
MSTESIQLLLNAIRQMAASGESAAALQELERLLQTQSMPEAHLLRLQLSIKALRNTPQIVESLAWLEKHQPDCPDLQRAVATLQAAVRMRVQALLEQLDTAEDNLPLDELSDLVPLADRFPALYLLWGTTLVKIKTLSTEGTLEEKTRLRRKLEAYRRKCESEERESVIDLDDLPAKAKTFLQKAIEQIAVDDELYGMTLAVLGDAHRLNGDLRSALKVYLQADDMGLPMDKQITAIRPELASQVSASFMRHMDAVLARQQLGPAFENLHLALESLDAFSSLPDVQVRLGDYYLLCEQLDEAKQHYQTALDLLPSNTSVIIKNLPLQQVVCIMDLLPDEPVELPVEADCIPGQQLGFPYENTRQRALSGLLVISQKCAQTHTEQALIHQIMGEPDVSSQTLANLLAALENMERREQQARYNHMRQEAMALWQAEQWSAALAKYHELCGSTLATAEDLAYLAVTMRYADQPLSAIADLLTRLDPVAWAAVPHQRVQSLIEALSEAGYWAITDRHTSALSLSDEWHKHYQTRRTQFIETALEAGGDALRYHHIEDARVQAQRVLQLEPTQFQARLLMGRAYLSGGLLAEARQVLLPLKDEATVRREAILALAEVDVHRGYLLEARDWLGKLADGELELPAQVMKTTIENRLANRPAITIEPTQSSVSVDSLRRVPTTIGWTAIFAVQVVGVRTTRQPPAVRQGCAELLMALSQNEALGVQTHFAWRYIGQGGKLKLVLLCRVEAGTQAQVTAASQSLWQTLHHLLPLRDHLFAYEPVYSPDALETLRHIAVDSACEIARQEIMMSRGTTNDDTYLVYPFGDHDGTLHQLLKALADQPQTTVLDVHFQPTAVLPWERSTVLDMLRQQTNTRIDALPELLETERPPSGDFRQELIPRLYPEFLWRTQSIAFVVQVQLASKGKLDSALPSIVRTNLFGTSRCEIVLALSEHQIDTVRRNLYEVTCERWIYSDAPRGLERWRHLLTPDETLTATRLPIPGPDGLPGIPAVRIRAMPLPDNLPAQGVVIGESVVPVKGHPALIRANLEDRMRHTYIVGRTGTGKSTLIQNVALQDIEAGRGVGVIDPHGDLVEAILQRIPPHRVQDVVLFDPSDADRPVGLNICDVQGTMEQNMVVADFIGLLYMMFDPNHTGIMGPRLENAVRNAMLTIMQFPGNTLIEVVRMLSDRRFREHMASRVTDPVLRNYWDNIAPNNFASVGEYNMSDYVTSKFGPFVDDRLLRNIIGQSVNTIDFAHIMNTGKILLVNLAKGKIGPQNSHFLGLLLVPRLLIAALSRAHLSTGERRQFCLYVDEFQNFTTSAFSTMLSETRKYGLAITMANQFISQLRDGIREAVFGNVGSLMAFQIGGKDAAFLSPEIHPADIDDVINLPNHYMLVKVPVAGRTAAPFPVHTLPDSRIPNPSLAETIRDYSRQRYGRNALIVSQEIQSRFKKPLS